ncbi:MAG: hypothetical protein HOO67_00505, partial [Candidatus Peribacteraceae bacterium]|nr:hypothetical protein [Candidatus Peribacteraceae bacterium]
MPFRRLLHGLLLLLLLSTASPYAAAQQDDAETIASAQRTVAAGDVFEILGVNEAAFAQFDWILTADGSFVEAGRENMFRTRLIQEGTYTLDGQFNTETGIRRIQLTIDVTEPREPPPDEDDETAVGLEIVTTDLPSENNTVRLQPDSSLLTLTPSAAFTGPIAGDLDIRSDTDGDGIPGNDNDFGDTLFSTEHNPLHPWFASDDAVVMMALSTEAEDGTPITQEIGVTSGSLPIPTGSVDSEQKQNGTVAFSFPLESDIDPATVVYQWYFGDGWQSLEDAPIHTYIRNDTFDVSVIVRELSTGHVLAEGAGTVEITDVPEAIVSSASSGAASSATSSSKPPVETPGESGGGSFVWTMLKILAVLLVAAGIGAGGVWAYRKFLRREGALQKALEQAESMLIKKQPGAADTPSTEPVSMALKRPEKAEVVDSPSTAEKSPTPAPTPASTFAPAGASVDRPAASPTPAPSTPPPTVAAPAWLEKGLAVAKEKEKTAPSSSPAPAAPPAPTSPSPNPTDFSSPPSLPGDQFPTEAVKDKPKPPAPTPSVAPAPSLVAQDAEHPLSEDDLLPPWLKEDATDATKETEATKAAAPSPVPSPPPPAPTPAAPPTPLAASTPTDTPSWLMDAAPTPPPAPAAPVQPEPPTPPLPPVITPEAEPAPKPESPSVPETLAPPPVTPALSIPTPTSAVNPEDQARAERERERKRRKRQRYRENLKNRSSAGLRPANSETPELASPASVTPTVKSETKTVIKPSISGPTKTETKAIVPAAPAPLPAKIEPKPASVITTPPQAPKPVAPAPKIAPKPVQKSTVPSPTSVGTDQKTPAPAPTGQKPVAKDIPKQETSSAQSPAPADDKIAFVIKAEGIEKKDK